MLLKDHEKRSLLIDVMNLNYFMMDDEDLEEKIKQAKDELLARQHQEEIKAEK